MISYIVASNDIDVLNANILATLDTYGGEDQVIVLNNPSSIARAYNEGATKAVNPIRCYVHQDVRIMNLARLRRELIEHCRSDVGMVGVIGSLTPTIPWWNGRGCGSVWDSRLDWPIHRSAGGVECAYLDGLLLATAQDVVWDEEYDGFHLYDHDICQQMLSRGLVNYCLPDGRGLVRHNTQGPHSLRESHEWSAGLSRFEKKWGIRSEVIHA